MKKKLLEAIKATDFISTTADCWSSRRRAFLGVTAHWLSQDLKRVSVCLALRRITEAHTYDVLAGHLESVHSAFGLVPARNLIETVTDGGSNILKSFKVFGVSPDHPAPATSDSTKTSAKPTMGKTTSEASIVAYLDELTDNDSNEDSDYQPDESKDSETEESISGTDSEIDFDAFIGELSDQDDIEETASSSKKEDNQTEPDNEEVNVVKLTTILKKKDAGKKVYNLPSHRRCAVHQLALVSTTDVNKIKDAGFVLLKKSTFKKLKKLWNKQSRSTKVSDYIVAKLGRLFVVPNITRWNSTYDATSCVSKIMKKEPVKFQAVMKHCGSAQLTSAETQFIVEYVKIFSPIAAALDILQGEAEACAGYLLPTLQIVKNKMGTMSSDSSIIYCQPLISSILSSIQKRFGDLFTDRAFRLAAFIHPSFKLTWLPPEEKEEAFDELRTEMDLQVECSGLGINRTPVTQSGR